MQYLMYIIFIFGFAAFIVLFVALGKFSNTMCEMHKIMNKEHDDWIKEFKRSIRPEVSNESNKVVMWRGKYLDEYSKDELIQIVSEVHMTAERERKQHEDDLEFLGI